MNTDDSDFDWSKIGPTEADFQLARSMLNENASFPQIRGALSRQGMKAEFIEQVITATAKELITISVVARSSTGTIVSKLTERGLTEDEAQQILTMTTKKVRKGYGAQETFQKFSLIFGLIGVAIAGLGGLVYTVMPQVGMWVIVVGAVIAVVSAQLFYIVVRYG